MDFITIDFETATPDKNSPCEIGLTFVSNNTIADSKSWLIKPYQYPNFYFFNVYIHGIRPEDVSNKPEFPEVWKEILPLIENKFLIAHNAGFDMSVLRNTLDLYNLPYPNIKYCCSYIFSKKAWENQPAYDLKSLCYINNIELNHHRAESDSRACADLSIKAFELKEVNSIDDIPVKLRTSIGSIYENGYKPCETKRIYFEKVIIGDPEKNKPDSLFYQNEVVFTGTLMSMKREDAQQIIADIGGINSKGINKQTNFLIVGMQDFRVVGEDGLSNKQEKAIKLKQQGVNIEILSENEFLQNI